MLGAGALAGSCSASLSCTVVYEPSFVASLLAVVVGSSGPKIPPALSVGKNGKSSILGSTMFSMTISFSFASMVLMIRE